MPILPAHLVLAAVFSLAPDQAEAVAPPTVASEPAPAPAGVAPDATPPAAQAPSTPPPPQVPAPPTAADEIAQTDGTGPAPPPPPAGSDEEIVETIEIVEEEREHDGAWMGVRFGTVVTPFRSFGATRAGDKINSNGMQACLDPGQTRYCGQLRGFDGRIEVFDAPGPWKYARWSGYFRTGYAAGQRRFLPADEAGFVEGEARSLAYTSVPVFVGGNLYLFKNFPVRPYAGLGFGFDVVRLAYRRQGQPSQVDVSARVGFELHAGLEAKISNYVSLYAEVTQQWSAKRKLDTVPDFSNEGLTFTFGAGFAIPTVNRTKHKVRKVRHIHHRR